MADQNFSDEIIWPCELSKQMKDLLMAIALSKTGIEGIGLTSLSPQFKGVCYIQQGTALICTPSGDLNNILGAVIGQGDWLGALTLFRNYQPHLITEEIKTVNLLLFPAAKVTLLAKQYPETYKWLYFAAHSAQPKWIQANLTGLHNKQIRVVYALLELMAKQPKINGVIATIFISQQQLSLLTGISRPRVNEVLKDIEKSGEIALQRKAIKIINLPALGARLQHLNMSFRDPREPMR